MPEEPQDNATEPTQSDNPQATTALPDEGPELIEPPAEEEPMLSPPNPTQELESKFPPSPVIGPVFTPFSPPTSNTSTDNTISVPVATVETAVSEPEVMPESKPNWVKKNKLLVLVSVSALLVIILVVLAFAANSWYRR